MIDALTYNIS